MRLNKYTKNRLLFCASFVFIANSLFAQKEIKNPNVVYDFDEFGIIIRAHFKTSKGGLEKAFDVNINNPYNRLSNTQEKEKRWGNNVYSTKGSILSKVLPNFKPDNYKNKKTGDVFVDKLLSTSYIYYSEDKNYHVAVYQLKAIASYGVIAVASTIDIIDSTGNVINRIKDTDVNVNEIGITTDGKYLFYTYGLGNEDGTFINYGFRIYKLKDNSIVVDKKGKEFIGFVTNNLFVFGYDYHPNDDINIESLTHIEVYDVYRSKKYTREFKMDEQRIISITSDGYLITYNNQTRLLSFVNDFMVENI